MKKINLSALPTGKFDLPFLGSDLTKELVIDMTSSWSQEQFTHVENLGYGHFIITENVASSSKKEDDKPK